MKKIADLFIDFPFMYGSNVRIAYIRKWSPRHSYFDGTLEYGKNFVEAVLSGTPLPDNQFVYLVFPERWMNVFESRNFRRLLESHADWSSIKNLNIEAIDEVGLVAQSG